MLAIDILKSKGGDISTITADHSVADIAILFAGKKIGFVVVADAADKCLGTVSERDVCQALAKHAEAVVSMTAEAVMTTNIVTCSPLDSLAQIMSIMTVGRTRHVVVMDDGRMAGVISIGDVVKFRLEESLLDEKQLRDYVLGSGYN